MLGLRLWLHSPVLLACCAMAAAFGDLFVAAVTRADDAIPPGEAQTATEGVLVMRTGTIVTGKIVRTGNLYEVQGTSGNWAVPEDLVKLRCASIAEAYQKLHESAKKQNDANAHLMLAKWCLTNDLNREARQELLDALALEPDREDAKRLLRNVDETIEGKKEPGPTARREEPSRTSRAAPSSAADAVSLGGLSRDNALQFSRRIQPLLVNNCTAAGCHGRDSDTGFRLQKVMPGKDANRHATERNLAKVLEFIDLKKPKASPVLTVPQGQHGRRGRPVFVGQRGDEQFAELQKWITSVAGEEAARERRITVESRRKAAIETVSASESKTVPSNPGSANRSSDAFPAPKRSVPEVGDSKLPRQAPLPAGRGDPFDPAAFNRGSSRSAR